jgi:GR25 family glycosyltransferase involved in LPS biosynthesis|tara:strand:- start:6270 stop:6986 length:717 start_codon:yes stop_codon:yes gene_type:complete
MKYYYINLDSAVERREQLEYEFTNNNINDFIRVEALPYSNYILPYMGEKLKNAKEQSCHRSHIKAINEFITNSTDDYAIICEDDLVFEYSKYWRCTPDELIKKAPADTGIIQLAIIYTPIYKQDNAWHKQPDFFKWGTIPHVGSCLAYIITRKCGIEMLKYYESLTNRILSTADSPSGIYGNVNNNTSFTAYTYKYPIFTYRDNNNSQLENCLNNQEASKRQVTGFLIKEYRKINKYK